VLTLNGENTCSFVFVKWNLVSQYSVNFCVNILFTLKITVVPSYTKWLLPDTNSGWVHLEQDI